MSCFIVPATEAVVTTIVKKKADKNHNDGKEQNMFIEKMSWLNNMLWGGSALLAFEHVWHGELVPFFPFLTNATFVLYLISAPFPIRPLISGLHR